MTDLFERIDTLSMEFDRPRAILLEHMDMIIRIIELDNDNTIRSDGAQKLFGTPRSMRSD